MYCRTLKNRYSRRYDVSMRLNGRGVYMLSIILYEIRQQKGYSLIRLVDSFMKMEENDNQGIIVHEYNDDFLKASYWRKRIRREKRYNFQKKEFEQVEEEIIDISEFGIQISEEKLLIFGNKQTSQRIITLIGVLSKNAYSITEYFIDIGKISKKICVMSEIELLKMKLTDIVVEKNIVVDCNVNLAIQDTPEEVISKYLDNIVQISFKIEGIEGRINIYKSGRVSITKLLEEDKDELIQKILQIIC